MSDFLDSGCDNAIRRSHGMLTSPGHAHLPYAKSQICHWSIELPSARNQQTEGEEVANAEMPSLTLALNHWDVADQGDQLQIFEGGEEGAGGKPLHEGDGFSVNNGPPKMV